MQSSSYVHRAATIGVSVALAVLPGCSNFGSRTNSLALLKKNPASPAVSLGKVQSDEIGRPVPGSLPPLPPAIEEQKSPNSSETRGHVALAMGELMEGSGNLAEAQAQYEQALKLDPKSLKTSLALARVYAQQGRPDAALKIYKDAEKQHRRSAAVFNDKGLLLAEMKDWTGALAALRTAVKIEPKESRYHNNYGMVLAASGDYEAAWKEFREGVGPGPAHYNVALMLLQAGRTAEARDHLERAVAAMPGQKDAEALIAQMDTGAPSEKLVSAGPEVGVELEEIGHLTVPMGASKPRVDSQISPAVATEPADSSDSTAKPESSTSAGDPWKKRWVPPKWLR